jgi:transcriptional regulator with XRE-family HTH domain
MKFADKLAKLMKEKRYMAKDIAEYCGVSAGAVTHWLNGECMPSIENLKKISQLFEVSIDEMLSRRNQ